MCDDVAAATVLVVFAILLLLLLLCLVWPLLMVIDGRPLLSTPEAGERQLQLQQTTTTTRPSMCVNLAGFKKSAACISRRGHSGLVSALCSRGSRLSASVLGRRHPWAISARAKIAPDEREAKRH